MADAGQSRHRYHRYANPDYPRGYYGWRGLRLFGFGCAVRRAAAQGDSDRYSGSTLLERLRRVHRPLKAALRQHLDLAIAEDKCHRHGNIV